MQRKKTFGPDIFENEIGLEKKQYSEKNMAKNSAHIMKYGSGKNT